MSYKTHLSNKKNLFAGKNWENNPNGTYSTFKASVEGETYLANPTAAAGAGILANTMANGKIYMASWDYTNTSSSTVSPYIRTASVNTAADGQLLISNNNTFNPVPLEPNLTAGYNFLSGWNNAGGGTPTTSTSYTTTSNGGLAKNYLTAKRLYRCVLVGSTTASSMYLGESSSGQNYSGTLSGSFSLTFDFTAIHPSVYLRNTGAGVTTITTMEIRELDKNYEVNQSASICQTPESYPWFRMGNSALGQDIKVTRPRLYEDRNWSTNIVDSGVYSKLRNHFRADCCTINSYSAKNVPTIYNTVGTTAAQGTATKQPLCVPVKMSNGYNKDYIQFDEVDDTLVFTEDISVNNTFDLWFVTSGTPTVASAKSIFAKGSGGTTLTDINLDFSASGGGLRAFYYSGGSPIISNAVGVYPPSTGISIIRYKFNVADGGSRIHLNGVSVGSSGNTNIPNSTSTTCTLGSRLDLTTTYLGFKLYEYLSFSPLTATDERNIINYLRRRYGSEANF